MVSHLHGTHPPFDLADGVMYFHDWRYVSHGWHPYTDAAGQAIPMWGAEPHPQALYKPCDVPWGIELVAQRPTRSEPVLLPDACGVMFLFAGSLIHDDGMYRLWVEGWPTNDMAEVGHFNQLRYAESDDGMTWRFPDLKLLPHSGPGPNNLVIGRPLNERYGFHGGGVFKDPSAPPHERYKAVWLGTIPRADADAYRRRWPNDVDPGADKGDATVWGPCGAVSPDGLRWTVLEEPLLINISDNHNVCEYDALRRRYVMYTRTWVMGRRTIGRSETADFRHFPQPEQVFWPGTPAMKPCDLWYCNGKTRMPGTRDYHLMFPMLWSLQDDRFEFHLASSPDNVMWNLVPGSPICTPGDPNAWDGGLVAPGLGLVDLPGDRTGVLVCGCRTPHKHPRRAPYGALGWATWPRGRLVALRAAEHGSFATFLVKARGGRIFLNCRTPLSGLIQVEVVGPDGKTVAGRGLDDCDPIAGDFLRRPVTWRGESGTGVEPGQPVALRFRLRCAELYAVHFG